MSGLLAWLVTLLGAALVSPPPVAGVADYQIGGAYQPGDDVDVVLRDRAAASDPDRYSICYVNAFQTQPGSLDWWRSHHGDLLLRDGNGGVVTDPDWPDEVLFDLRGPRRRADLVTIVDAWFADCAAAGFEAVEPDNLDSWTRSWGLLSRRQAIDYARDLVRSAHRHGLAIAQKNAAELTGSVPFDFAVAEECEVHRECDTYTDAYGQRVIEIEYTDNPRAAFSRACAARSGQSSILLRDREVARAGAPGHVFEHC